jgi:putative ABC transport system permease protein
MVERPLVLINDILARERKLRPGSVLPLRTPQGRQEFQVAATIVDYSCDKPLLLVDRGWLKRLWDDELVDGVFVRLKKGASIEEVRRSVYERVGGREQIFIYSGREIRNEALRVFDQTFLLVKGMEGVALLVAILGIFHTLWSEIMDRAGEISTLRAVGMLASQLRTCFAVESALMGLAAGGLGIAGGLVTAYYLIRQMIPAMVGWHISYRAPWGGILAFSGSILVVTVLAGTLATDRFTRSVEIRR